MGNHRRFKSNRQFRMQRKRQQQVDEMQQLALVRIQYLFSEAFRIYPINPLLSNRYIEFARRLAMATRTSLPPYLKRYICHGCKRLLVTGQNMHIRIRNRRHYGTYLAVTCLDCRHIARYIIKGRVCRRIRHQSSLLSSSSPESAREDH
jgi:RNase P subunit RPR2